VTGGLDWVSGSTAGEGPPTLSPADELLHGSGPPGDSLSETWFWGFNVPEAGINCFVYCKVFVNLGVALSGLLIYRGIKQQHLACELFDVPAFSSTAFVGDGSDIRAPNGLRVRVVDPLQHVHLTYADPSRETEVDVHLRAAAPPVVRANGKHFEQVMRTEGALVLRGERHVVDGFIVRDRSWGELRPESAVALPPYNWVTGVGEGGGWAFNVGSHDDPDRDPDWAGHFDLAAEQAFKDGWVLDGDRLVRLRRASKRTHRDPTSFRPVSYELDLEDVDGRQHHITGEVVASVPWGTWHNITSHLGLVRWDIEGRAAWGESQDVQWNEYVWRRSRT